MATPEERKEFDRHVGVKQLNPVPKPPDLPLALFSRPEQKALAEKWNKDMDDWRKKIPGQPPIEEAAEETTTTTTGTTTSAKGPKGEKGDKGDRGNTGSTGPSGPPGPPGADASDDITLVATEDIAGFQVVTSTGENADSSDLAHLGRVVGISKAAIPDGFAGQVAQTGELTNLSWTWSGAGVLIYLNGTSLSETAPSSGFLQKIGVSVNGNKMIVELDDPILL